MEAALIVVGIVVGIGVLIAYKGFYIVHQAEGAAGGYHHHVSRMMGRTAPVIACGRHVT